MCGVYVKICSVDSFVFRSKVLGSFTLVATWINFLATRSNRFLVFLSIGACYPYMFSLSLITSIAFFSLCT